MVPGEVFKAEGEYCNGQDPEIQTNSVGSPGKTVCGGEDWSLETESRAKGESQIMISLEGHFESNDVTKHVIGSCICYFSHGCDKGDLGNKGFIMSHSLRGESILAAKAWGQRSRWPCYIYSQ